MGSRNPLAVGDLFLAEPIQISKGQVKAKTSRWVDVDNISVTHDGSGAFSSSFAAKVRTVSDGSVSAEKILPTGSRMIVPGNELNIDLDTITPEGSFVADVSAATNLDFVQPASHSTPGASLNVQIIHVSDETAYADVLAVERPGATLGDQVDVQLERSTSIATFDGGNLESFSCRLDRKPTAGGPGIARITRFSPNGIGCELEQANNNLQIDDQYKMTVENGKVHAVPTWNDSVGVDKVMLDAQTVGTGSVTVELTSVKDDVRGRIHTYLNAPAVGSRHRVALEHGQDELIFEGIPIHLDSPSEITGDCTIQITEEKIPQNAQIVAYHNLPARGETRIMTLERGQDSFILDGVPIELEGPSEISGRVSIEIVSEGVPMKGKMTQYHGLPAPGDTIDCRVARGAGEVEVDGIPFNFTPQSHIGILDIRLTVLKEGPPVTAELTEYPCLTVGETVRAEIEPGDLLVAYPVRGDYSITLVEPAERAAKV